MRIKGIVRLALIVAVPMLSCAAAAADNDKLRLIVQITADQLRGDLLDRYRAALPLGFGQIEAAGYWIHQCDVDHALTLSFQYMQVWPRECFLRTTASQGTSGGLRKTASGVVDASRDDGYKVLDAPKRPGISPKNMLVSTLGEWTKSADPRSKSVSLGTAIRSLLPNEHDRA